MQKEIIDKVALLHIRDKKILMAKSYGRDVFYTPGGKREGRESDIETLAREIKEELGVDLMPESAKYYGTFCDQAHNKPKGVIVEITCYVADLVGDVIAGNEIENLKYCDYSDYYIIGKCDQLIFDDLKAKNLID